VNNDGVNEAISVICGFFTIATLIVLPAGFELAVPAHAALMSAAAAPATKTRVSECLPNTNLSIRVSFPVSENLHPNPLLGPPLPGCRVARERPYNRLVICATRLFRQLARADV
jgi:hypothetical protein